MKIPFTTYEETCRRFRWDLPATFNYGRDVVDLWSAVAPERLCLQWQDQAGRQQRFAWREMCELTNRFANTLAGAGVRKGDRVIVMLPRIPEWQIALVGCTKLGAIPVPCIEMLTGKDVAYRIRQSGAVAVVTTRAATSKFPTMEQFRLRLAVGGAPGWADLAEALSGASASFTCDDTALEDPAIIYYTSGSTGLPKGVTHASRGLYTWRNSAWYWHDFSADDLVWCTADTGWSKAGTAVLFAPWSCGASVFFYDGPFDARRRLDLIERNGITVFCGAATEFRHLINEDLPRWDLSRLRLAASAGEMVNPEIVRRWEETAGCKLVEAYGQTETLMTVANHERAPRRLGSMGRPLPGTEMAVLDDNNAPLPPGRSGQLAVRLPNPQLMLGYWNEPERTAATRAEHSGVEYFLTGDRVSMDADGYLYYEGRTDDIISSAGYRIGPVEIENALAEHPAVLESAAVPAPDAERGEIVMAYVVVRAGFVPSPALAAELQDHVKHSTAPYKYPRAVVFIEELPKTASGKILRRELKARAFATAQSGGMQP
ncbi:MAG: acyl--CoA ligase [Hyphomicrobiaceae bacterium]|nr:MAG: acyl--CoA ligase [Hyphomicrobiaceae bacterium]